VRGVTFVCILFYCIVRPMKIFMIITRTMNFAFVLVKTVRCRYTEAAINMMSILSPPAERTRVPRLANFCFVI
jgi:hypothetical protein